MGKPPETAITGTQPFIEDRCPAELLQCELEALRREVEHADLEAALATTERRALREIELLYRLADAANRARSPDEVYEPALDAITQGLQVERASILLVDPDGQMRFKAWRELSDAYRVAVEGHCPWKVDDSEPSPILISDVQDDPSLAHLLPLFQSEGMAALGFIPLVHQKRLLGKFMIYAPSPRTFTPAEVQFAITIASHISQAVARNRLYAEAEAASQAKDAFISLLGHELRNPLSPIFTALHLMRMRDDTVFRRERSVIERQVKHLARLVDDLLDVSRIARGMIELRKTRVNVQQVIEKAVEMAAPLLEERSQHLEVDIPAGLAVEADEVRLAQVVGNLLHNAAKFTGPGGRVWVCCRPRGCDEIEIKVVDTGCGLAPELLPRMFEMFSQGRRPEPASHSGLGLGLAIVKSMVELHGGTVQAHSDGPGRGSTFVIRLPVGGGAIALPRPVSGAGRTQAARASRCVLVVDDNVDAASYLTEALREAGHRVECAHDGPSALRVAERFCPEVALLDIGLPVMDGYELGERLVSMPGLKGVQLVAVTGYGQESDRARSLRQGFAEHLAKPVELDTLLRVIEALQPAER